MTVFSWPVMLTPDGAAPEVEEALVEFVQARYYIARIDGSEPKVDLEALVVGESAMTSADINSEAQRCGVSLAAKGQEISQMANNITERAKAQSDKLNSSAK